MPCGSGKWKLASRHPNDWELYDTEADRTEMHDLAKDNPDEVKTLSLLSGVGQALRVVPPELLPAVRKAVPAKRTAVQIGDE